MEPKKFVYGSKTFDIARYSIVSKIGNKNCIQSEPFTVGGYDWVIEYYPQGINESVSNMVSVSIRVLNTTEELNVFINFSVWDWTGSRWIANNFKPVLSLSSCGCHDNHFVIEKYIPFEDLNTPGYYKDDTLRLHCVVLVAPPRPPAPALALKPDVDMPSGNGFHTAAYAPPNAPSNIYNWLPRQPTVRIYCKANKDLSVTIRNGTVVLAPADSNDYYQHWIKDMSNGDILKDSSGLPAFALVNRVTGEALKNPAGENQEVSLFPYNNNGYHDVFEKWTEVWSTGFRAIRIAHITSLNLTAVGSDNDTNFSDGSKIIVKKWVNTPVQRWNIVPYNSNVPY